MAHTLLVANRGEIALRVFRTANRMGMRTVAVYSDADSDAPHTTAADVRKRIGPAPATESYLRRDRILEAARDSGADLIHPGYGFLAEDDRFAKDCEDLGFIFVGPSSRVLAQVGDKIAVRRIAKQAGVPLFPAYDAEDRSDESFARAADEIGYPVLVKPAGGGGGKGMAVVEEPVQLANTLASSRRVARAAFDDDRLMLERYVEGPRHVEVQIVADAVGHVLHLGLRDCSLQRRHQKLLEEAPPPNLDDSLGDALCSAAVALASGAGYRGAGTCEFLLAPDGTFGFMEMNARLQVEHPVTEMITGLDLVELQLRIALGEELPFEQEDVRFDGHSIEVRVYAEDPEGGFLPQAGRVEHVRWPSQARIDTWIEEGTEVTSYYDPLLAKLIVKADDRVSALWGMQRALDHTELLGVRSNISFLSAVVADPVVVGGKVTTDWLEPAYHQWRAPDSNVMATAVAAAAEAEDVLSGTDRDPWTQLGPWRTGQRGTIRVVLRPDAGEYTYEVVGVGPFVVNGEIEIGRGSGCHRWWWDNPENGCAAARSDDRWFVWVNGFPYELGVGPAPRRLTTAAARLDSPLPGQVIAVRVGPGQQVAEGEELVVVEAMKMEHAIKAPGPGIVRAVLCTAGDRVDRGQTLIDFEAAGH